MVVYEVNLTVDSDAATEFEPWLRDHVVEMLQHDGFERATWFTHRNDGETEGNPKQWTLHYRVRDLLALNAYFDGPAEHMRAEGLRRFGGRFSANRRILERKAEW